MKFIPQQSKIMYQLSKKYKKPILGDLICQLKNGKVKVMNSFEGLGFKYPIIGIASKIYSDKVEVICCKH